MRAERWRQRVPVCTLLAMGKSKNPAGDGGAPAIHAALYMIVACLGFAVLTALIRHLSATLPAFELAFFRNFFGLLALAPWFWRNGFSALRTNRLGLYCIRVVIGLGAMLCWFYSVTVVPLAQATALSFTAPLFATVLAIFLLGEKVRLRRWSASPAP